MEFDKDWFKINVSAISNPPFGHNFSLAKKLCTFVNVIVFILPSGFRKLSMQRAFDENIRLVYEWEIFPDSFIIKEDRTGNID